MIILRIFFTNKSILIVFNDELILRYKGKSCCFFYFRSPYGPYDERYEADRQYLDPHMRKFENSVRRGN